MPIDPSRYPGILAELTGSFEQLLRDGDLSAPVPCCGDWTLADLGEHLGATHRWAAEIVRSGEVQRQRHSLRGAPVADWYGESATELRDALAAADPTAPCWSFGTEQTAAFWFRRQVQETLVHRYDARCAVGLPDTMEPALAADGVDEVLVTFLPKISRWHQPPELAAPLLLRSTDSDDSWLLRPPARDGESPVAEHGAASDVRDQAAATVRGGAEDLLLLLWKRRSAPDVELDVAGDSALALGFLRAPLTP